jgi:hypothetical protein
MGQSSRLWLLISGLAIWLLLVLSLPKPAFAADNQVVFIFGGDVEWSLNARPPTVRYRVADPTPYGQIVYGRRDVRDQVTGDWPPIPYVDHGESGAFLKSLGLKRIHQGLFDGRRVVELSTAAARPDLPWRGSGHGQLRGRSIRSRPPGWLE